MRRPTASPALWAFGLVTSVISQELALPSKPGLAYIDSHEDDIDLLLSPKSSISWYYTWSMYPTADINSTIPFVPLVHGLDDASSINSIADLPATSTHLLTFNEPDGTTSTGGSSISPSDAAQAYINDIVPLRTSSSRSWKISHPAVTGSDQGLAWLREFNAACWEIDSSNGCPTDFVALHWYGDFAGLASWLGTLRQYYVSNSTSGAIDTDSLQFWITEMALPKQSEDETAAMMNQSMSYLDGLDYVQAYAWYGAFRKGADADSYTGDNVALFNKKGALTDVGALYLGGKKEGFKAGMTGTASGIGCGFMKLSVFAAVMTAFTVSINL
ncbi:Alkali-sensitive linkage protein 1 [Cytospora mali]|uniref:Alkali-sensitive linkage protein 1 n=1 Tax=Cytospora mali TaxID=578113 RepID=A0A194URK1_CYTMA|nr:Alkali-sensitive linkage protein 1 [Valsa mali var. pyri (nom. inval.)]